MRLFAYFSLALFCGLAMIFSLSDAKENRKTEKQMYQPPPPPLPFQLTPSQTDSVLISLAVFVPKTGMGKEQVEIRGDGTVRLIRSDNDRAPDQVVTGEVDPKLVIALLMMFEEKGFWGFEEIYTTKSPIKKTWMLKLSLPIGERKVYGEYGSAPDFFNEMVGAVRMLSAVGAPRSLGRQFFLHL